MARRANRFTIYDAMEAKGVFEANPANADSRDLDGQSLYQGPVTYPKMLYHPQGLERVTVPAEIIVTPLGPQRVNEQKELIWQIVASLKEEKELLSAGWHDHPSKAIRARLLAEGKDTSGVPDISSDQKIQDQEQQIRQMQAELADLRAKQLVPTALPPKAQVVRAAAQPVE